MAEQEDREDRRKHRRADLQLSIELRGDVGGEQRTIELALTRNVSAGGVYLAAADWESINVGKEVGLTISTPCHIQNSLHFLKLEGRATVIRKEDLPDQNPTRRGVALEFGDQLRVQDL